MRYALAILTISVLLAGASPLCAMAAGGGGGFGGGGGGGGGFGGGGIGRSGGGHGMKCTPTWVTMTTALDRKSGLAPGIILVFVKNTDTSALWTDALLKDETFKRLRHVRVDAKQDEALVAKHGLTVFPSLVYCDGYGNPVQVQERPSRAEVKAAHAGLAERIATHETVLRKQLAGIGGQPPAKAEATLKRIAALAGPIAEEARLLLTKRQAAGIVPAP